MERKIKNSTFTQNLRLLRSFHSLTGEEAANKIGMSMYTIYGHEAGTNNMNIDTFEKYCKMYNVTPNELLGWEEVQYRRSSVYEITHASTKKNMITSKDLLPAMEEGKQVFLVIKTEERKPCMDMPISEILKALENGAELEVGEQE